MNAKKRFLSLILSLFFISSFCQTGDSFVVIKGTTNINTFKCINNDFHQQIPLTVEEHTSKKNFSETNISLLVKGFDCKNKVMTADFRNTLNAEKFPYLNITFISLDKVAENKYKACVQVKMMNKLKKYIIDFSLSEHKLFGAKTLYFSDFEIVPPKKFGGMIYVKDALDLSFSLKIKE